VVPANFFTRPRWLSRLQHGRTLERSLQPKCNRTTGRTAVRHLHHDMTTRRHYAGSHAVQPIVNGVRGALYAFELGEEA
jgi:hypothetical protein